MLETLEKLGYKKINGNCFMKMVKKINDYVDDNGALVFSTVLLIGFVIECDDNYLSVVDAYAKPFNSFKMRTRNDLETFNKMMNDFQDDIDKLDDASEAEA